MKKLLLLLSFFPIIVFGQLSVGNNQTICLGDSAQIIATLSGPGTAGCSGATDSLASDIGTSNGSAGTMFNIINTSANDITITGFSQGTFGNSGTQVMDIWYYPGDYIPVMSSVTGWTQVATAVNVNIPAGASITSPLYSLLIPISSVIIPAGATYGFYVGGSSVQYSNTPTGTTSGVSSWGSNSLLTITVGHGGPFPSPTFTPRGPLIKVYYGGGASWYNVNSGQMIGGGDTLVYSPTQTTDIAAVFDCNGNTYSDTMKINVLNTNISTAGFSLCNGLPLILTAATGFSTYNWNGGSSTTGILTVNSPGTYYVDYITSSGMTCQSSPITIYQNTISIALSTPDSVFICQGDTVIIDGPTGFATYNWSTGATTSSITTTSTGNYSLSVVDGNGCTGISNTTSISISPQTITATTTGLSLCNGSVTLDAGSGFATYQWYYNGSMMTNTSQTLVVTIGGAGAYHCEVVYPTGCTAISNSMTIVAGTGSFNVIISAIGADSLCEPNGQVVLDAGNYASFIWSTGETTQHISINTLGSYSVDVVDANGCQGSSNIAFEVFDAVNTSVISGPTNPTQFQTVTYSVLNTYGSTYNWTLIGGTIQSGIGTNSIDVLWNNSGMFSLSLIETNINGCIGDEIITMVSVIISSIEEINNKKKLNKVTDVLGRETNETKNQTLFYIYDDKTVEKRIIIE